mgnify:CR=1 FL=1
MDKEEVINRCREAFNNIKVIDKSIDDEVAIFIECTSEAYVEKFIEEIEEIMKDFRAFREEQETHIPD